MDEKYWSEAKNKGYVVRSRTVKSLSWCFMNKRKLFNGKAFDILKIVKKFPTLQFFTDQNKIFYYIRFKCNV